MFRRLLRQGIRAVASGHDPGRPAPVERIPTYCHDTILHVPPAPGGDDRRLLREIGAKVTRIVRESADRGGGEREAYIQQRVQELKGRPDREER